MEKQIDHLNLLIKHGQEHLLGGGKGDDVAASGCSRSGTFKLLKRKRPPKAKSTGVTRGLTRSSVETVSVKPKVRIKDTRLADLENQLNVFKEALVAAARKPVKIQVRCQKLRVKIRDGKYAINTDPASDGSIMVALNQEEDEARGSPSRVNNAGLVQETHLSVGDAPESESHSELRDGVRSITPSRVGDRCLDLSSAENHLQVILSRVEDCHLAHTTMSRLSSPDLIPEQKEKALLRVGSADLLQETPYGSPDLVQRMPSRQNGYRLDYSHSFIDDEATATRRTTGKFPELSNIQDASLLERDRQIVFTQDSPADASQTSLVDMSSPMLATQDSPEHPYTHPTHLCSDTSFDVCCCHAHAPKTSLYTAQPNRFSLASGVTLNKHHNLRMSDNISDGNNDLTVPTSFHNHPLPISRPVAASVSPYSRFTFMDKQTKDQSEAETTPQPLCSCCRHGARTFRQDSQISLSPEPRPTTSQNHEINKPVDYPYTLYGSNSCRIKLAIQKQKHAFDRDHLKEGFSPWTSITEKTYPKLCCWHSSHNVGNDIHDSKHNMEKKLKNHASLVDYCLPEDQRFSRHTTNACKHSSHATRFQPDFSVHHFSRKPSEGRFSPQIPSSTSRFEYVDSAGGDIDSRATFMSFNSRKTNDATLHEEHSIARYAVDEQTKWPASSKLPESCAYSIPCSQSRSQSPNPQVCPCHRRLHDNNHYRNQQRIHSHKQFPTSLEHEVYFQNHHCHCPLCHKQRLVPVYDDITPPCSFLANEDSHLRQNNNCLTAQMQYAGQHPLMQLQNSSLPCSSLSRPYPPSLEENAHNLIWNNMLNKSLLTSTSSINNCEERCPHIHNLKQADPTAEEQYSAAVTEHLPSCRNYSTCLYLDDCTCKRQIEGKQSCLLRQQN